MKRVFLVFLSVLLLLPVLLIPAGADEVYIFYLDESATVSDDEFIISVPRYRSDSVLSSGSYTLTLVDFSPAIIITLSDFVSGSSYGYTYSEEFSIPNDTHVYRFRMINDKNWGYTNLEVVNESDSLTYVYAIRKIVVSPVVVDPFEAFFSDALSFVSSGLSTVSNICSVIVNDGFLLLCAGFLFLGGLVGLSGSLMSRD